MNMIATNQFVRPAASAQGQKIPTDIQELANTLEEMSLEFDALKHKQKRILEKRGWKETCATPGSVWMWEKQIADGRTLLVSFESAWCSESVAIELEAADAAVPVG